MGHLVDGDGLDEPVLHPHLLLVLSHGAGVESELHPLCGAHHDTLQPLDRSKDVFLSALGEVVVELVEGLVVDVADRQVDQPGHAGLQAGLDHTSGGVMEGLHEAGAGVRGERVGGVDHSVRTAQGVDEALASVQVNTSRARQRDDLMSSFVCGTGGGAAGSTSRTEDCNLHAGFPSDSVVDPRPAARSMRTRVASSSPDAKSAMEVPASDARQTSSARSMARLIEHRPEARICSF